MSHRTRRKHVIKEMMEDDYELPKEQQQIVRVISSRGNNLLEVEPSVAQSENFLVSISTKFRKNLWVKRGDFILVDPIEEGDKVKAEICKVLTPAHVKEYTKAGVWPERFAKKLNAPPPRSGSNSSDEDDLLAPNTNRPVQADDTEDETEDSSDED
ncbi:probable RNA-binding protein EIF1AD [Scaptodrosophila lebanonensis]|uniref:Probable RNA-binding protein EIF1AD n=1 Tax=Drosophila lebanonensis TaxID=7225 RepID=A0A6J2U7R1_DROLE|nr:probable RNA-binding protein EIF1AD [Scaptodrosophila lebanonensis]